MSIFKDTFRPYVRDQLALREEIIALGNREDSGIRTSRNSSNEVILHGENNLLNNKKVNLPPGAFYNYTLNRQCIIRMTSMVDYVEDVGLDIGGLRGDGSEAALAAGFNAVRGAALSQNFILEGGTLSDYARVRGGNREVRRVDRIRDSFPRRGLNTNTAYGDIAIGANASSDGFGIVPMPGITDINVRTKSAYGSLREAKVNFECHNRRQLEVLEMLYMRPGYMVILEWGWNPYIKNDGTLYKERRLLEDYFTDTGEADGKNSRIYTNNITQQEIFNAVNVLKEFHNGNYDGFLGFVKNFGFQAREDGGYTCYTELVSVGEVIDSLRIPNISITDPVLNLKGGTETTNGQKANIVVKSDTKVYDANQERYITVTRELDTADFNEALAAGIFPRYNGLLGLIKSIYNYCSFNDFSTENRSQYGTTEYENQKLNEIFKFNDSDYVDNLEDDSTEKKQLESQKTNAKKLANTADYSGVYNYYLRDLVKYQATSLEQYITNVLGIPKEDVKDYIIPAGSEAKSRNPGGKGRSEQPFIRWDVLCTLINENLITKDAKALNPVKIVSDRIYNTGEGRTLKVDPLLFCPISDFTNPKENALLDYSCDANVCILPMQFETNVLAEYGGNVDAFGIGDTLGYIPDTQKFPAHYIIGSYGTLEDGLNTIKYRNTEIKAFKQANTDGTFVNPVPLTDTDRLRRIGSIFLNVNMLNDIAEKHAGEEDYTLGKFLNDIWGEVNKVCPNHNFVVTDDKESNTIFVIDLPVDSSEVPSELYEFIPFSNKNILREFSYTSNVPKAMSATVAIQAQDPRSIQDIDGVTFAAFNRAIKNRILSTDDQSDFDRTRLQVENQRDSVLSKQNQLKQQMDRYVIRFFKNLKLLANEKSAITEGNIKGITKEYQKNATYISQAVNKVSTFTSVIPLEFNATLDGISGIVIGNIFKVREDRLPKAYQKTRIGFIVFSEDQKVTAGGDWTTEISGKMTILPEPGKKPIINGISTSTFTDAEILNEPATTAFGSLTQELAEGQGRVTDIDQATTTEPVFLKKMADNSIHYLKTDALNDSFSPWLVMNDFEKFIGTINVNGEIVPRTKTIKQTIPEEGYNFEGKIIGRKHGFASVRSTPQVDNGSPNDNFRGMIDCWANGGALLGLIKASGGNFDPANGTISDDDTLNTGINATTISGGRFRMLPSKFSKYFNLDEVSLPPETLVTFVPNKIDGRLTKNIGGREYYVITKPPTGAELAMYTFNIEGEGDTALPGQEPVIVEPEDTKERYILASDATNIQALWYNIEFDPSVDPLFFGGWAREGSDIDPTGATPRYNPRFSGPLSEFSKTNDCWMSYQTLAATPESAVANVVINEGSNPEHPESTPESTDTEFPEETEE